MQFPKPKICPKAVEQMRRRVEGRPWAEVKREEDRLWATKFDCPGLGLKSTVPPEKKPERAVGEKLAEPLTEPRIH